MDKSCALDGMARGIYAEHTQGTGQQMKAHNIIYISGSDIRSQKKRASSYW